MDDWTLGYAMICGYSVAAVSLIDLIQIVRHFSVGYDSPNQGEALVSATSHEMYVMLKVPQTVPLGDLIHVPGNLKVNGEKTNMNKMLTSKFPYR